MKFFNFNRYLFIITFLTLIYGCTTDYQKKPNTKMDQYSYELGVIGGFSELINAGVKELALSAPMISSEMDRFILDAEPIALKYDVSTYRESDLIVTDLFPSDVAKDKDVLLLFTGKTLEKYLTLKTDKKRLEESGMYNGPARIEISRRFGRMLSYSPRKINKLLSQNTSFRTMDDFGIRANNLFLYYKDLKKAEAFYTNILGMEKIADYEMAVILRMAEDSFLILVDSSKGMHTSEEPKTVALALLTDQLEEWYSYLLRKKVSIKYKFSPEEGSPHDGFVAIDPEGYLLEFENFNQHPENENFIPLLNQNKTKQIPYQNPIKLNVHSTIIWLYYKDLLSMEKFYQDVLGLEIVADQGWTKIYKVSNTGFIGMVDEKRGMHKHTKRKAVNVGFIIDDLESWFEYSKENKLLKLYDQELGSGPETRYKSFVGFDPEDYFLEFDRFFPHEDNELLLEYLNAGN